VALNLRELREWPPEIADLAGSTREAAANHTNSADFYRSLATASTWEGDGGDAARAAMVATAAEHDGMAESLGKAATGMEHAQQQAEQVAQTITDILNYAAEAPAVQIDESTNQVIPPDTTYLDDEAAAKVAAKVADLQAQIAAALAQGEGVDADLAGAIATATGTPAPEVKTESSVENLFLPGSGERQAPPSGDRASQPDSLDSALDQLAGTPGPASSGAQEVDGSAAPVPLNPAKIEQFRALARQTMLRDGVPPDQIEARLDAMVAAARQPLKPYTPPDPDKMPPPGFAEGFADRWFETEQGIKNLIGQGGPGAPGVWESWRDLLESTNDQFANPVGTAVDEVKNALNSPSAAYYLGGKAAEGAIAAPGVMFGGEGALVARAGALDDLAGVGAIPRDVIDVPSGHHNSAAGDFPTPLAGEYAAPDVWDYSDGYSSHAPEVASNLNDAFVNGQPTVDLARQVADLCTHHMPGPFDIANADRVVLGKWAGMDDGYIGEARSNGGIYFDTGDATWNALGHGLSDEQARTVTWQVNEEFLRTQLENGVARIEYLLPDGFDSVEQVAAVQRRSFSALEINFLKENAAAYGYTQRGNSWVYEGGN
jgi:hypothetical protein